ncbi:amidohydrolase family protein [Novosphingobium sp. BL-52-GroH]|uniref:N-acyl-D-amino-acid deacylase family protein n=1 Tax=Novosphingobium sp. BL-52-GroH TaxID=3349877 RepID=UPI00384B5023
MADFDLVVRGGTVADGTGGDLYEADVGVVGDRIIQVGRGIAAGREEIDARGRLVTPGFVDIHTHFDGQVTWDHQFAPSTGHGVTTLLMGNCGVGFAPCRADQRDAMIDVMEGVEDIPGIVMREGLPWNWESFPDYLDALDKRRMDADFATQVPHIPVRVFVMGQRAIDREPARAEDMRQMAEIVREGMAAGAFGFSTSRVIGHRTANGAQLPVTTASEDELTTIALAMRDVGNGLFMSASEFDTGNGFSSEFRMLERIAQLSRQTVFFPLLQYNEAPDRWLEIAEACAQARAGGADIYGQVTSRPVGVLMGLELSLHPFMGCPAYQAIALLPLADRVAAMRTPQVRARILAETPDMTDPILAFTRNFHLFYAMGNPPEYSPTEHRRFDRIAERLGTTAAAVAYDVMLADNGRGIIYFPARNFTACNLDTVFAMLRREDTVLGLGDGGAHLGAICDGSLQTYMLSYWTRDRQGDKLSIAEAVHAISGRTADVAGFTGRGYLKPGYKADLNVIDYDNLRLEPPRAVHDLPAGGRRLTQDAIGYDATILSGRTTYRHGTFTGALPGRLLRKAW